MYNKCETWYNVLDMNRNLDEERNVDDYLESRTCSFQLSELHRSTSNHFYHRHPYLKNEFRVYKHLVICKASHYISDIYDKNYNVPSFSWRLVALSKYFLLSNLSFLLFFSLLNIYSDELNGEFVSSWVPSLNHNVVLLVRNSAILGELSAELCVVSPVKWACSLLSNNQLEFFFTYYFFLKGFGDIFVKLYVLNLYIYIYFDSNEWIK